MSRLDVIKRAMDERKNHSQGLYNFIDPQKAERFGLAQYKLTEGDHFLRIIPPKDINQHFAKSVWVHEKIGADSRNFVCLEKMGKGSCPICEKIKMLRSANPEDPRIKGLYAHEKVLMIVVDYKNDKTISEGWRYITMPPKAYTQLTSIMFDKRTGVLSDISDPKTGRAFIFTRKGTGLQNTEYLGFQLDVPSDIPDEWLEVPDFEELIIYKDPAEISEALSGFGAVMKEKENAVQEDTIRKPFASFRKPEATSPKVEEAPAVTHVEAPKEEVKVVDVVKSRLDAFKARVQS